MAKAAKSRSKRASKPALRSIPGGRGEGGGFAGILSGKVAHPPKTGKKSRTKRKPTEEIPENLRLLANLYAAGKTVEREVEFKARYAEQRVKEHCVRRFAEVYAASGKRPPSMDYTGDHSRFSFVQTSRTYLTYDKVTALQDIGIAIDRHTELRGLRVNYEAIRRHKLENKLRTALEDMGVSNDIVEECFVPDVQLKPSFYEVLDNVVRDSLQPGERLEDKIYEVISILSPAHQVRNLEAVGLDAKECFDLIHETEVAVPEGDEADIA